AAAEAHLAACGECARELQWLRAEKALMESRADRARPLSPELWQGVRARLEPRGTVVPRYQGTKEGVVVPLRRRRFAVLGASAAPTCRAACASSKGIPPICARCSAPSISRRCHELRRSTARRPSRRSRRAAGEKAAGADAPRTVDRFRSRSRSRSRLPRSG